ncbi:MAG: DUF2207 domain-containing protein [Schumannella sp.]
MHAGDPTCVRGTGGDRACAGARYPGHGIRSRARRARLERARGRHERLRVRLLRRAVHADPCTRSARPPRRDRDRRGAVPSFDQNRGIIRSIPDWYGDVPLDTQVLGITDENGDDIYYEVQSDGGFTVLIIDDDTFKHGATTYVIHYTQVDTIRAFADAGDDEFYWDVNGTGWDQPFGEVSATVLVGPDLAAELGEGHSCYAGPQGSTRVCPSGVSTTQTVDGGAELRASATNLGPRENLAIVVAFLAGTFVEGEEVEGGSPYDPNAPYVPLDPIDLDPPPAWALATSLLGGIVAFVAGVAGSVATKRRRAVPTGFIVPQYSVPKGLDVMVAAELIQRRGTALQACW